MPGCGYFKWWASLFVMLLLPAGILGAYGELRAQTPEVYQLDVAHGFIDFNVRLIGFNRVRGTFDRYRGDVLFVDHDPSRSAVAFAIDVNSVRTGSAQRDKHLQHADFFDATRWPHITFASTTVEASPEGFIAVGRLTIRDVTRMVRVPFKIIAPVAVDPFGNTRFSAAGRLVLNRHDFGVVGPAFWNRAIADSVEIEFEMPGRRWNYQELGFGPASRPNGARLLLEALETKTLDDAIRDNWQRFTAHRADSAYNFGPFEYQKAAGRLAQAGKVTEAIAALQLAVRIAAALDHKVGQANLHVQLAETLLREGKRDRALGEARSALLADPLNTGARLLTTYLEAQ